MLKVDKNEKFNNNKKYRALLRKKANFSNTENCLRIGNFIKNIGKI